MTAIRLAFFVCGSCQNRTRRVRIPVA